MRGAAVAWLALLAVAGCAAVGGPLAAPPGPEPVPHIAGADGTALALSIWEPAAPSAPKAVILGVHGFGDYGLSTFEAAAESWAAQGIATYAFDQRGFGRNPSFGRWPGAEALVADLVAVAARVRALRPCLPLTVVGHSMGGGVALAAAARGMDADGLVLAAPAIWGGEEMNPVHRVAAWTAAVFVPEKRFTGEGIVEIQATDNIPLLRQLARDPHYLRPPSARELYGLVRITDLAAASAERVRMPSLLLLGDRDEIAPNDRVRRVYGRLAGPREAIEYPNGWHLLFRDLQAARVWRDVGAWVLARKPATACRPGAG